MAEIEAQPGDKPDLARTKYLVFEGGGGKGAAYLGAIIALEELKLLPIKRGAQAAHKPGQPGPIIGISGGSVGSITAFLLALGYDSGTLWKSITDQEFKAFLDGPDLCEARAAGFMDDNVPASGRKTRAVPPGLEKELADRNYPLKKMLPGLLRGIVALRLLLFKDKHQTLADHLAEIVAPKLLRIAERRAGRSKSRSDDHIVAAIKRDAPGYLQNLLYDPGLFPAFEVREFLRRKLEAKMAVWKEELEKKVQSNSGSDATVLLKLLAEIKAETMTFVQFRLFSEIDLIVAGTNLSTSRPAYFSSDTTPYFPVIEAVGLSMSIPFFFKSVYIDVQKAEYAPFKGWWADGGVINNLPLHAFNTNAKGERPYHPHERLACTFNEATVGFVLDEPDLSEFGIALDDPPEFPSALELLTPLQDALLFSSSEGQMRTSIERAHVIRVKAYFLGTYDLVPDKLLVAATVPEARNKVHRTFGGQPPTIGSPTYRTIVATLKGNVEELQLMTGDKYVLKVIEDVLD